MAQMHIVFSSDENYAQHLGASIYSLLSHNADSEITIYIIDNGISTSSKERLYQIAEKFPLSSIEWIDFSLWNSRMQLNMKWDISRSAYGRIFLGSMLPRSTVRCLYLDCDMIVCDSLDALWNWDMEGCTVAAVQDTVGMKAKTDVGLLPDEKYFNSGLLLIDLEKWRRIKAEETCLRFITDHNGSVTHHDQGVLNGIFHQDVSILPLDYNVMTIHYIMDRSHIMRYFREESPFYSDKEIAQAKARPTILHYTPSFTTRPWVKNCRHPKQALYWDALAKTPWVGAKAIEDNRKWYVRLIDWRYRCLPY